jgi:hypothetical protein
MAQITNTFDTYQSNRNREVLSDLVDNIDPDETPLYSMIGTEKVDGVNPQWNTDTNDTPTLNNKRPQGDIYDFKAINPTTKVGNYTQIMMKEFIVAETQEAVIKAGPKSDYNKAKLQRGVELRTDIEVTISSNQASVAGSSSVPAQLGGLRAWIASNDSLGSGGASGGFNSGTRLVVAATNGTKRAFTKTLLDDNIQTVYQAGGMPNTLMVSPYLKRVFSGFMSDSSVAQFRKEAKNGQQRIYAAADEYQSDFGLITVVPNRQWARYDIANGSTLTRNAFLFNPAKLKVGVLRPIQEDKDVAKTSDAMPGVMKTEITLIVKNEKALGCIADLNGLTSVS